MNQQIQKIAGQGLNPVVSKPKALEIMAAKLNVDPSKMLETLKATVFKQASNEELVALVVVSNEYGLNPFLKEIYAFPAKGGGIVPVISIDGWIKMINRQPNFDGIDFVFQDNEDGTPYSCTANIYAKGRSRPTSVTEYFSECFRATEPWKQMPRRMLRHKAMIQAGRVAFGFSGVHDEDEAIDIASTVIVSAPTPRRQRLVESVPDASFDAPSAAIPEQSREIAEDLMPPKAEEPKTIHQYFQEFLDEIPVTFDAFRKWGAETGNLPDAGSIASLDQCDGRTLRRLLNAKAGLTKMLRGVQP